MDFYSPITSVPLIGKSYQKRLEKLNIKTVKDLLLHIPSRYEDYRKVSNIKNLMYGDATTVQGIVDDIKNNFTRRGKNFQSAVVSDDTGSIQVIWFNQTYITKNIDVGDRLSLSGKVGNFSNKLSLISPSYEIIKNNSTVHTAKLVPVYPETAGVSSKWIRSRINYVLKKITIEEHLPNKVKEKYDLVDIEFALNNIHQPHDFEKIDRSRKRLAFDELLDMQIKTSKRKMEWQETLPSHRLQVKKTDVNKFLTLLPFELTDSQKKSIDEIFSDLSKNHPMNRLLEGDVGSGKTVVAAAAAYISYMNGYQSVIMAPTQILAEQHLLTFSELFDDTDIKTALITSSSGMIPEKIDIFIGTHALIHNKVNFVNVAFVAIDEQHRFGVEQRNHLVKKSKKRQKAPHTLTMTATPIPRTIALTFYGDLDLSTLDELPKGRQPITTWVVPKSKREGAYQWIKEQISKEGVQVFVVCPLIEESDHETMQQVKAATVEYERLKETFSEFNVGLLHGKKKGKEKTNVLDQFKQNKIDILVSTPVVEVGIDIPNATIMLIETAERFGLAQLHQLRGRVGRGSKKSYCLLFTESKSDKVQQRLKAMTQTHSGFELAELDLQMRGPGEILGVKQHGFPELKIANWQDKQLIKDTKLVADQLLSSPKEFKNFFNIKYKDLQILN